MFPNTRVNFPSDNKDERLEWIRLFGVTADIESGLRASICHLHVADFALVSESTDDIDSPIIDISIQNLGNSRCPSKA